VLPKAAVDFLEPACAATLMGDQRRLVGEAGEESPPAKVPQSLDRVQGVMPEFVELLVTHGVLLVFAVTLAARIGLPVPAAPLLVLAGGLAATGRLPLVSVALASLVANLLGDAVWFQAGRRYGGRVTRLLCRVSLSPDSCVRSSESLITRWGGSSLTAAKFIPGVSVVAAPLAGALQMTWSRFIVFDSIASGVWISVYFGLGWTFHTQIDAVLARLADAGRAAGALAALAIAAWLAWRAWRRWRVLRHTSVPRIDVDELLQLRQLQPATVVIDVRGSSSVQLDARRIPGALSLTIDQLDTLREPLRFDQAVVLYCNCPNEISAAMGALRLRRLGFRDARPLKGGLDAWVDAGFATEGGVTETASAATYTPESRPTTSPPVVPPEAGQQTA
jgi:membrane protein DedA with SNARE-associated domain/rhodanese-related sulfurtransferase